MYFLRLILLALAVWLIYRLLFAPLLKKRKQSEQKPLANPSEMVECQYCKLHIPQQEAVAHRELWFCCKEHKEKFLEDEPPQ